MFMLFIQFVYPSRKASFHCYRIIYLLISILYLLYSPINTSIDNSLERLFVDYRMRFFQGTICINYSTLLLYRIGISNLGCIVVIVGNVLV